MPTTYTQIYLQIVFAVSGRQSLIQKEWKDEVYSYIGGIIKEKKSKPIIINGMPDHIHIFIGYEPTIPLHDLVREIKCNSSKFINEKYFKPGYFHWQNSYGAFSYSRSHIDNVYHYIKNQEAHHQKKSFKNEYLELLKKFEVEYDERYLFYEIE